MAIRKPTPTRSGRIDPISGEKKRRESLQRFAARHGWDVSSGYYNAGNWRFTNGERSLYVNIDRNYVGSGALYESERHGGKPVHRDSINDVLAGMPCLCSEDKDHYGEWIVTPECKVRHR